LRRKNREASSVPAFIAADEGASLMCRKSAYDDARYEMGKRL
jgi:hypothetical protein